MQAGDRVLVTGASGFVGSAVLRALEGRGLTLRVLVRASSPRTNLEGLACEIVTGDMRHAADMSRALEGVDALFHAAADYRLWARDPMDIIRANLEGTRTVMEAALTRGVKRIVYTSSVATLKTPDGPTAVDETCPLAEGEGIGAYKESKVCAERLVERMIVEHALPAVIVMPSTPIGPRDVKPTPTGRTIVEAATGKVPAFVDTGLNWAHVDDVAAGHLLAFAKGRIGERYILGGENLTLQQALTMIAGLVGRKPPTVKLPINLILPIAYAAEAVARITGKEPFVTVDGVKLSRKKMFFSIAKARTELGYTPRPALDGFRDAIDWFRANGYLGG